MEHESSMCLTSRVRHDLLAVPYPWGKLYLAHLRKEKWARRSARVIGIEWDLLEFKTREKPTAIALKYSCPQITYNLRSTSSMGNPDNVHTRRSAG